ncbi:MAG: hypothetical protein COB38_03260 [Gammaproteobacteria bacterium]|nr:MAG: hypothetical protein COB38_03260 [Gammaproteobacteria bacterium]
MKKFVFISIILSLTACSSTPFEVLQGLFGYTPPPEETTVGEELKLEFDRCERIDRNRNCAQIAYDMVRTVKGLEPRKVPKGVVIILEGNVKMDNEKEK